MKKTYETSKKARGHVGWWKHLRKFGKRVVNKSTRKIGNEEVTELENDNTNNINCLNK